MAEQQSYRPPPNGDPLLRAARDLQDQMIGALRRPLPSDPAYADQLAELCGQLVDAEQILRWCRDGAVVLARRAGARYSAITTHTGVPDSTLASRRRRFERDREAGRG
jgi:hypothetical protein